MIKPVNPSNSSSRMVPPDPAQQVAADLLNFRQTMAALMKNPSDPGLLNKMLTILKNLNYDLNSLRTANPDAYSAFMNSGFGVDTQTEIPPSNLSLFNMIENPNTQDIQEYFQGLSNDTPFQNMMNGDLTSVMQMLNKM